MEPSYSDMLRDMRWQRKRLKIMERDRWRCRWCMADNTLQVHHKRYVRGRPPWEAPDHHLITLCERCHQRATELLNRAKDVLADLNVYDLPVAVAMIDRYWSQGGDNPLQVTLDRFEAEKAQLIGQEFTPEASRKLEALDEVTEKIWAYLHAGAAATGQGV